MVLSEDEAALVCDHLVRAAELPEEV